ncbi:substrate-binding domain-containing protein [Pectobacteriaceae bacterium CE70]|nr:substrate-binding domain-containing protein [Pectobacteriaceae bacterium C52]WJV65971.1 substrate-binding domain-containing protein [Pectobacteriaceae bacterium CE70]WJY09989.1 substrate-binding domain-containing protein [Pectobacteriaceae bacterium C80]
MTSTSSQLKENLKCVVISRERRPNRRVHFISTYIALMGLGVAGCAQAAISAADFTPDFSAMSQLHTIVKKGSGKIGVILPETTTSARYTSFDQPYLEQAFKTAGLTPDQYMISNAQGSEATQLTQAQSDIAQGASVLLIDPISSGGGAAIEQYAKAHGVPVIDYDRITLGGNRAYYVSFNNVEVGKLIGKGLEQCITDWQIKKPHVLVMSGAPTDNNATLFHNGYMSVLQHKFKSGAYVNVGEPAGSWDPAVAQTTFQQQFTAHPEMNAVVTPNDGNANAVIAYLKTLKVPPHAFPTTGQDATLTGIKNIITGYQCGTVYKPIYLEAQAAAALAIYLRAGMQPPKSLVNGKTLDSKTGKSVPSVLASPIWVTPSNVKSTVIKDGFVKAAKLCQGEGMAKACQNAQINP